MKKGGLFMTQCKRWESLQRSMLTDWERDNEFIESNTSI